MSEFELSDSSESDTDYDLVNNNKQNRPVTNKRCTTLVPLAPIFNRPVKKSKITQNNCDKNASAATENTIDLDSNACTTENDSTDLASTSSSTTTKNKKKYFVSFNEDWLKKDEYKNWLEKYDNFIAKCRLCSVNFVIKHDGIKAVKSHEMSKNHRTMIESINDGKLITAFIPPIDSPQQARTTLSELAMVYHAIRHQHSYNSTDCGISLNKQIYFDSPVSTLIQCGRTKATSYAENVLGEKAIEIVIDDIKPPTYFSISTDASNRGNIKLFPIVVTYFKPEDGIKQKIIDFYSDDNESSLAIYDKIKSCLNNLGLSVEQITAFSADNANVNYGNKNSVFTKLKNDNKYIIKANCNCHVIHNAAKYGCRKLSFDVETLVNKIYSEFSCSTTNRRELQECFVFFKMEFSQMVKNVPTRWLSLSTAVDKIIGSWPAIKLYFINQGIAFFIVFFYYYYLK